MTSIFTENSKQKDLSLELALAAVIWGHHRLIDLSDFKMSNPQYIVTV